MRIIEKASWATVGPLVLLLAVQVSLAQRTTFEPAVTLGYAYTDNVEFADTRQTSDSWLQASISLPVKRQWTTGSFEFRYRPSFLQYNTQSQFDHDNHRIKAVLDTQPSEVSQVQLDTTFTRTQPQGIDLEGFDEQLFAGRRTEKDTARLLLVYRRDVAERWKWDFSVGASSVKHREIDDFDGGDFLYDVEDRDDATATIGFAREISRRSTLGLEYGFRHSELSRTGNEDNNSLALIVSHDLGRKLSATFRVGGFRSTGAAADGRFGTADERSGFLAGVELAREFRNVAVNLDVTHAPVTGVDLVGTSTVTQYGFVLLPLNVDRWTWELRSRYARRDPADPALETDTVLTVGGAVEWLLFDRQGIRLGYTWRDQSERMPAPGATPSDPAAFTVTLGYVWYPLKKTTLGGK